MSELVLVFTLDGRRAALPTDFVHSVVELDGVTPIPHAPRFVMGLSALRSHSLTVIDAAAALGIVSRPVEVEGARAAIVELAGHRGFQQGQRGARQQGHPVGALQRPVRAGVVKSVKHRGGTLSLV